MKIKRSVFRELIENTPALPPESGGILGGRGGVVTCCRADAGLSGMPARYVPDTDALDRVVEQWHAGGTTFYGMYHSHYPRDRLLSRGDRQYIERFMRGLPGSVSFLYFPIVLPGEEVIVYRADRTAGGVRVVREEIEIC